MLSLTLVSGWINHKSATAVSVKVEKPPKMKIPYLKLDWPIFANSVGLNGF